MHHPVCHRKKAERERERKKAQEEGGKKHEKAAGIVSAWKTKRLGPMEKKGRRVLEAAAPNLYSLMLMHK